MSLGLGEVSALASALAWAIAAVFLMWGSDEVGIWTLNAYRCAWGCGVQLAIAGFTVDFTDLAHLEPFTWLAMLVSVVLGLGLGGLLLLAGLKYAGAAKTAILVSTTPLFATPIAVIFLNERLTWPVVAATLGTIAGVGLIVS